jgi:23S rRNA (adenine2503-C2)-methyltransferase
VAVSLAVKSVDLRSLSVEETRELVLAHGQSAYRGEQLWRWVHDKGVRTLDQASNLPRAMRDSLAEAGVTLSSLEVADIQRSTDGTRKMRLVTSDGRSIETVLIPDGDKMTQCISSQVGCALDCQFCATAKLGLTRNLSAGEIVDHVYLAKALLADEQPGQRITNIVYMGMGEPLHNFDQVMQSLKILTSDLGANLSHRRITVSTVGLVPGIRKLGKQELRPNLAVSLNASCNEVRDEVMPINKKYPIEVLLQTLREFPLEKRRRITFEYVLLAGVNDSNEDAERVARLLRGMPCKLNIIPFNPHPLAPYKRPSPEAIDRFQMRVRELGLATYLRTPRGDDISAACGQLANRAQEQQELVQLR